jgi:beta-galactosidase
MTDLSGLRYTQNAKTELDGPIFLRGKLNVEGAPKDTFLKLDGFTKGFVVINGRNIGRYFNPTLIVSQKNT